MARRSTSRRWLETHVSDPFVRRRQITGYRSRAAFKLEQILSRDRLLKRGDTVLELGSSPGGWTQVAAGIVGPSGRIVAVDLVRMAAIPGVSFIHGDCRDAVVRDAIRAELGAGTVDLVMSDMAPNISGIRSADAARSMELNDVVVQFAEDFLRRGGALIMKVFQHAETDRYVAALRQSYAEISRRKPRASRPGSAEFYVVARGFGI